LDPPAINESKFARVRYSGILFHEEDHKNIHHIHAQSIAIAQISKKHLATERWYFF
jgi:hypothetical protein